MRSLCVVASLVTISAVTGAAQRLTPALLRAEAAGPPTFSTAVQVAPEPGIHQPLLPAVGLGLLGWGAGALAGRAIQGDCIELYCEFEGIFYGGAAGGGLGLAVGAHLGNQRGGSFLLDIVASGVVWGAGYALLRSFADKGDGAGVALTAIVLPPTQLAVTVLVERATGRARARRSPAP